jgi:hypothetical protein
MWIALLVTGALLGTGSPAGAPNGAVLTVAPAAQLTLSGAGFAPGVRVTVTLAGLEQPRRKVVRASARGRFTVRFAGLGRCSITGATAVAGDGGRARVPPAWFVRRCPPPPPLDPAPTTG